jgi:hypothetical protein
MTPHLTQQLFERFDHLYRGRHLPLTQNLMSLGFQCGDGWFDLIYTLSEQIEHYSHTHPEAAGVMAVQVKQKFGTLRFYVQPNLPEIEALISATAQQSAQTCEVTGQPGVLCSNHGSYCTLSGEMAQQLGMSPVEPHR